MMFEDAKLLTALISAAQWCKPHAHISFLSEVIEFLYVATQQTECSTRLFLPSTVTQVGIIVIPVCLLCRLKNVNWSSPAEQVILKILRTEGVQGLTEFQKRWRQHFFATMKPRYLPSLWRVDYSPGQQE